MTDDLRRRVVNAMLAVDVKQGGKADMYMLADAAIAEVILSLLAEESQRLGLYDAPAGVTEGGDPPGAP